MIYAVTYSFMDATLNSGPMGHACLLLSKLDEQSQKLEVVESWGYYGMPATNHHPVISQFFINQFKSAMKLNVSFLGNHGKWCHEETRYLDQGHGLYGRTFALSEEEFNQLSAHLHKLSSDEDMAIEEAARALNLSGIKKFRKYPFENDSRKIFEFEKQQALKENRASRLHLFEIRPKLALNLQTDSLLDSLWPVHFRDAHTCKSGAVDALSTVLDDTQIGEITANGKHPTIPRLSGHVDSVLLHSEGPLVAYKKSSGSIVYNRDVNNSRIFWSVPPQLFDEPSSEARPQQLRTHLGHNRQVIQTCVGKLQQLEWTIQNAEFSDEHRVDQASMLLTINKMIKQFSVIPSAFSSIEDKEEQEAAKLGQMEALLDIIYTAITTQTVSSEDNQQAFLALSNLKRDVREQLCDILQMPFIDPGPMDYHYMVCNGISF